MNHLYNKLFNIISKPHNDILEEFCCDVNAICSVAYIHSGGKKYDQHISEEVIKSIRLLSFLLGIFKMLETVYSQIKNNYDIDKISTIVNEDSSIYLEHEMRDYVIFIAARAFMGLKEIETHFPFFDEDDYWFQCMRPYSDMISPNYIEGVYHEKNVLKKHFKKEELMVARDIIIGWHNT